MANKKNSILLVGLIIGIAATVGITATVMANFSNQSNVTLKANVNESPSPANNISESTSDSVISSGTFVDGEHATSGKVTIVTRNGKRFLELGKDFQTSDMGPDLVVILHRKGDVIASTVPPAYPIKKGDYVILAPLKSFKGAQTYEIPENINLDDFLSAAIWCRKFNATFGAATLMRASKANINI